MELIEYYNVDENFEQTQSSLSAKGIYKNGYGSTRLLKFLCQKQYYKIINYYDLLASVLYANFI